MRFVAIALFLASPALWAQAPANPNPFGRIMFPGTPAPSTSANASPFGRILFPGTGAPAVARVTPGNRVGNNPPTAPHPGHSGGSVIVPYPVYFNGGNYIQYDPPQAQLASSYTQNPQQPDASPVIIVNQYFRPDESSPGAVTSPAAAVRAPEPVVTAENQDKDTIFLIAMKDHSIYAASAYWVEGGTLNYITIQGSQNSASMDLVDRDLSLRLNKSRSVAFGLPTN